MKPVSPDSHHRPSTSQFAPIASAEVQPVSTSSTDSSAPAQGLPSGTRTLHPPAGASSSRSRRMCAAAGRTVEGSVRQSSSPPAVVWEIDMPTR